MTVSVGMVIANSDGSFCGDELLAKADAELYAAKEDGRDRVCIRMEAVGGSGNGDWRMRQPQCDC